MPHKPNRALPIATTTSSIATVTTVDVRWEPTFVYYLPQWYVLVPYIALVLYKAVLVFRSCWGLGCSLQYLASSEGQDRTCNTLLRPSSCVLPAFCNFTENRCYSDRASTICMNYSFGIHIESSTVLYCLADEYLPCSLHPCCVWDKDWYFTISVHQRWQHSPNQPRYHGDQHDLCHMGGWTLWYSQRLFRTQLKKFTYTDRNRFIVIERLSTD